MHSVRSGPRFARKTRRGGFYSSLRRFAPNIYAGAEGFGWNPSTSSPDYNIWGPASENAEIFLQSAFIFCKINLKYDFMIARKQMQTLKNSIVIKQKPTVNHKSNREIVNLLNDLTSKEWVAETVSVWVQKGLGKNHKDAQIEREHPAPFSYQDVSRLIRFFTKRYQTVLDPFVGVGSTLKAAAIEGRRGIGIELNPKYVELAKKRLRTELTSDMYACREQEILLGDAADVIPTLPKKSINLVITSPPYWNILHKEDHKVKQERRQNGLDTKYSNHPKDLGNITSYPMFLNSLVDILTKCRPVLVDDGYMCIIVGDFRNKSRYYMFHADLASAMEKNGFSLKGLTILHQKHKRVFPYGYPYAYVPNLHHQYILILKKDV
ncbi:MAG: DNA methyltransferase [Planctomycetota bacterium]